MLQPVQCCLLLLFITITIYPPFPSSGARPPFANFPSANISTLWINNQSRRYFEDRIILRSILKGAHWSKIDYNVTYGPIFSCGFFCTELCTSSLFSIYIDFFNPYGTSPFRRMVWSANRNRPVHANATLEFSKNGNLLLRDFDGTQVWSTNTSGKSVVGMKLNEVGNLVLFDNKNRTVWSSLDYPTDCWVLGQTLRLGQRLTADVSLTNSSQGPLHLSIASGGFQAFVGSQLYYDSTITVVSSSVNNLPTGQEKPIYVMYNNGSLKIYAGSSTAEDYSIVLLPRALSVQYMQLDYMGHSRIYDWSTTGWVLSSDFLSLDDCAYPTVCGEYGICSNGQCTCPASVIDDTLNYFRPVDQRNPNSGCTPLNAISCKSNKTQQFLPLLNMSYFNYIDQAAIYMNDTNEESCKQACSNICSCKAALFQYGPNASSGNCFLPSELYSLTYNNPEITYYNSSAFIKVQSFSITNPPSRTNSDNYVKAKVGVGVIVGASVASLLAFILIVACFIAFVRRRYSYREVEDVDEFDMLPGLPTRFAFEDLRVATDDFLRKLGEGGFGSVFEGTLIDGTRIAVKRLDGVGQGKKEFLAEVETIGSIHHIHLVRLIGFCAEKFYRLLVYEYMSNGSLDKWIFYKDHDIVLDWQTRRKIINDIAKGLAYLHEDCRQKIVHLDIKPQNILLDETFNAKVSDFGLAKLIDRDQVEVMTRMRGTPGYLAPEWLTSVITEKVDVFSFGVVVLEIVCGRRNIDNSKDEESFHLIGLLQRRVAENKLVDMVDCRCTDMQININDVIMIMHLAMWCLQSDSNKRPLMSVVLKVLDGSSDVEANLDYNFANPTLYASRNANIVESVQPTPSILSGPR